MFLSPNVALGAQPVTPTDSLDRLADVVADDAVDALGERLSFDSEDGALSAADSAITINDQTDPVLTLREGGTALAISDALPGEPTLTDAGDVVFESLTGDYSVVPVAHAGSVQITTVLNSDDAPSEYRYDLAAGAEVTIELFADQSAIVWNSDNQYVAAIAPPWAYDQAGTPVNTWFTVEGSTLVQHVEHRNADVSYPVTADPWMGINLFDWANKDTYRNAARVNAQPSAWGYSNVATLAGQAVMRTAGWDELLGKSSAIKTAMQSKESMRQQFDCHALGSYFAGVWNLEAARPTMTVSWLTNIANHHCNWTTAGGATTGGW